MNWVKIIILSCTTAPQNAEFISGDASRLMYAEKGDAVAERLLVRRSSCKRTIFSEAALDLTKSKGC